VGWQFRTYDSWLDDWFTGFHYDDPNGNRQWVSVDDPTQPQLELPRRRPLRHNADGRRLISMEHAAKFAKMGLDEYKLAESSPFVSVLREGRLGRPAVVYRLDRPGHYYYLAPWEMASGIGGFVEVDARFGVFKSFQSFAAPAKELLLDDKMPRLHEEIARRVEGLKIELDDQRGFVRIRPGGYALLPFLVWRPCRESWSPSLPFHMISTGGQTVYVRIDGEVFTHLTTNVRGC